VPEASLTRLGILGGTFDPPHYGHLILAEMAADGLSLDCVLFVPAADPPHKGALRASAEHRAALVERAIAGNPRFALSRVDLDRPGPHYTADMLRLLRQEFPAAELVFLIGSDSLRDLPKWSRPGELIRLARLGVMHRPGSAPDLAQSTCELLKSIGKAPIQVRKSVPGFVGNRIQHAMMREALYLIEEGVASPEDVDTAVRFGFGFRFLACGPILQKEMSGWDTNCRAGSALYPHLHNEAAFPPGVRGMVERGHTGMKALHGFWEWTPESAAAEKHRIERILKTGLQILREDLDERT
jgi:nicotinate (nicotinamide) nucleotide adenylyltransferase